DGFPRKTNKKAQEKLRTVLRQLGLPTTGKGPFARSLSKAQKSMLNERELLKLEVEHARLKADVGSALG
ncbi:unnamed protein product, partial [Durusdinium trenchii]